MNNALPLALLLAALGVSHAASAATDAVGAKQMEECFRKHGHLMDKPAVRNERACWMAHAYLMERR